MHVSRNSYSTYRDRVTQYISSRVHRREAPSEEKTTKQDGKFDVDYQKIMEWNNLSTDMIYAGKTNSVRLSRS